MANEIALIVGAGNGLSASLARACAKQGMQVALAARNAEKLAPLVAETGARAYACDARSRQRCRRFSTPSIAGSVRRRSSSTTRAHACAARSSRSIRPGVANALEVCAFGGFLVAQEAAKRMLPARSREHPLYRRLRERERLCAVGVVRDG